MNARKNFPLNVTPYEFEWFYNTIISQMSTRFKPNEKLDASTIKRIIGDLAKRNYTTFKQVQGLFERHKEDDIFDDICRFLSFSSNQCFS